MRENNVQGRVLSVGTIAELLSLREQILRAEGYSVFTTSNVREAVEYIQRHGCGTLLICYSISDECRSALIDDFREHCPEGRAVGITNRPVTQPPKDVDELVYGIEGPEALLEAVRGRKAA